jgi:hypothetical protein
MTGETTLPAKDALALGVRRLVPATTTLFEGTYSMLHCAVKNEGLFRSVYAVRLFPVRHPLHFISLRHTTPEDKDLEIGVIEDLGVFPPDQQDLLRCRDPARARGDCHVLALGSGRGIRGARKGTA